MAYQIQVSGRVLIVNERGWTGRFEFPAPPFKVLTSKSLVYAAVQGHGVYVIDISVPAHPRLVSIVEKGNDINDISIRDGALIITKTDYSLKAYDIRGRKVRDAVSSLLAAPKPKHLAVGRVTSVDRGWAVIRLNPNASVARGSRIEIRSSRLSMVKDPFSGKTVRRPSGDIVFVGDISEIRGNMASVKLSKGDFPRPGDEVWTSERTISGSLMAPSRPAGVFTAFAEVYPQIADSGSSDSDSESTGYFSMLMKAGVYYHGFGPWSVGLEVSPLQYMGRTGHSASDTVGAAAYMIASYETSLFAVGLGFGYQHPLMASQSFSDGTRIEHNRLGWALVEQARLGALDGIHLFIRYQSVYCRDNASGQLRGMLGHFHFKLMLPLEMRSDLLLEGIHSNTLSFITLGVRLAFRGMGGPGTTYLKAYMGYMSFTPYYSEVDPWSEKSTAEQLDISGPVVGVGMEKRW